MKQAEKKCEVTIMIKNYYIFEESNKEKPIAKLTIHETLDSKDESIEIMDESRIPFELQLIMDAPCNDKVTQFLVDRAVPPNRCFLDEYCKEKGLNPYSLDDRLSLSHGRTYDDDYYIEIEKITEDLI